MGGGLGEEREEGGGGAHAPFVVAIINDSVHQLMMSPRLATFWHRALDLKAVLRDGISLKPLGNERH